MSTTIDTAVATHTYRVWIKAAPEQVWDALTNPATLARYGYGGTVECDFRPGSPYRAFLDGMLMVDGEIVETDAPKRLVQTWHARFDETIAAEATTRVTYEIEPGKHGVTKLTVTHELDGAPIAAGITSGAIADAGGGWGWILSDLKTLLESGEPLPSQMF